MLNVAPATVPFRRPIPQPRPSIREIVVLVGGERLTFDQWTARRPT